MSSHIVHIFGVAQPDGDETTLQTVELNYGPYVSADRVLIETWAAFYGLAIDNGQTPQHFTFTWVDEFTVEVQLHPNHVPAGDAALEAEVFTLKLEV